MRRGELGGAARVQHNGGLWQVSVLAFGDVDASLGCCAERPVLYGETPGQKLAQPRPCALFGASNFEWRHWHLAASARKTNTNEIQPCPLLGQAKVDT